MYRQNVWTKREGVLEIRTSETTVAPRYHHTLDYTVLGTILPVYAYDWLVPASGLETRYCRQCNDHAPFYLLRAPGSHLAQQDLSLHTIQTSTLMVCQHNILGPDAFQWSFRVRLVRPIGIARVSLGHSSCTQLHYCVEHGRPKQHSSGPYFWSAKSSLILKRI